MADYIEIKIDSRKLQDALNRLAQRTGNLAPLMSSISQDMLDAVEENFEQQGRPRWKSLAESTIEQREKLGYWPGKILQMRGELAASVQAESGANYALVGTNKIYAAIQHFGGKAGRGKKTEIPPRPFLALRPEDERRIMQRIEKHLGE